jgi:hypothetical protein
MTSAPKLTAPGHYCHRICGPALTVTLLLTSPENLGRGCEVDDGDDDDDEKVDDDCDDDGDDADGDGDGDDDGDGGDDIVVMVMMMVMVTVMVVAFTNAPQQTLCGLYLD